MTISVLFFLVIRRTPTLPRLDPLVPHTTLFRSRYIFSYYASTTSDPYNFSRVEFLRGPASVLFGQGSIGGIVNLVSKTPDFTTRGEINLVYGSYDRKEVLGDVNLALEIGRA